MLSYRDLTEYFGSSLSDRHFQSFLTNTFFDLSGYDISESDYIVSKAAGIELGFKNSDAVYDEDDEIVLAKGNPVFSHFNIFPRSSHLLKDLPFTVTFSNNRSEIINKAGSPLRTNQGYMALLNNSFLVDNYELADMIIVFDYNTQTQALNFIQIRSNSLVKGAG